jgi:8-oxo-dGTP diphosphatase
MNPPLLNESNLRTQATKDNVTHFATGIAVFQNGKLLVVRRVAEDDFLGGEWELPGGGVDSGETITQGAIRELFEETGLTVDTVLGVFEGFDYTTPTKPNVRQINFKVSVHPGEVKLEPQEHDEYRWITVHDVPSLRTNSVMERCLKNAFDA